MLIGNDENSGWAVKLENLLGMPECCFFQGGLGWDELPATYLKAEGQPALPKEKTRIATGPVNQRYWDYWVYGEPVAQPRPRCRVIHGVDRARQCLAGGLGGLKRLSSNQVNGLNCAKVKF